MRSSVVSAVKAALRAVGASSTTVNVYDLIADSTDRRDWALGGNPICFRQQSEMASDVGISERHFRRIEVWLESFGAVSRLTADNGYRGRRQNDGATPTTAGLSLAPSLANQEQFAKLRTEAMVHRRRAHHCRLLVRITRQQVKVMIAQTNERDRDAWERRLDEADRIVPLTARPHADELQLQALQAALNQLLCDLRNESAPVDNSDHPTSNSPSLYAEMSGAPDIHGRCHIQHTTEPDVYCNAHASMKEPAGKPADDICTERPDAAGRNCLETKHHATDVPIKPEIARLLTPERLFAMASEDLAHYLDAYNDPIEAMQAYLAACGVNRSAWNDAVAGMGADIAFIGTLVLDRNRQHPSHPVVNLAGALRGLTAAARAGKLNLTRSIIGLWQREEDGSQPMPERKWVM